ncbi:hypothetical protein ACIBO5_45930 [Nonomuraea angiospora]
MASARHHGHARLAFLAVTQAALPDDNDVPPTREKPASHRRNHHEQHS